MFQNIVLCLANRFKLSLEAEWVGVTDVPRHCLHNAHISAVFPQIIAQQLDEPCRDKYAISGKTGKYPKGLTFPRNESKHKQSCHTFPSLPCGDLSNVGASISESLFPRSVKSISGYKSRKHTSLERTLEL